MAEANSSAASRRRSVAIVGAGMAGVSLAWLLDGARDVVLLEARDSVGGNVQSLEVDLDGHRVMVDLGAQYFHPGPYPVYSALLRELGLYEPGSPGGAAHSFPASITLTAGIGATPRFVSPVLPERRWPFFAPWNAAGLGAFGVGFIAARVREHLDQPWDVALDEWLPSLGLARKQWEGMLLPWAASLFSGSIAQARRLSARAAMIFAARALPANPFDPLHYHVLTPGMIAALTTMLDQCSTVQVLTGARVVGVARTPEGRFVVQRDGGPPIDVDDLVLASSGPSTVQLLDGLGSTAARVAALGAIEFHQARVALHTDPTYAPADPKHRSFFNCDVRHDSCEASMWLTSVIAGPPPAVAARIWKSWFTHRPRPEDVLHEAEYTHMLPTVDTVRAQDRLASLQGADGIWLAGGYQFPYDAQETALLSALQVARGLEVTSARSERLLSAWNAEGSKRKELVESDTEPVE
jgi:predicted NAD/FAD-binding protein